MNAFCMCELFPSICRSGLVFCDRRDQYSSLPLASRLFTNREATTGTFGERESQNSGGCVRKKERNKLKLAFEHCRRGLCVSQLDTSFVYAHF